MAALQLCERPIVLFDFDGTVADTGRAVMTSTRKTLAARGFSEAQMGDLRRMIGPPLWKSFHDFYGFTREESLVVADEYRAFFDELGPEEYPVFDGISQLLDIGDDIFPDLVDILSDALLHLIHGRPPYQ